jgi:hypothetical protein
MQAGQGRAWHHAGTPARRTLGGCCPVSNVGYCAQTGMEMLQLRSSQCDA